MKNRSWAVVAGGTAAVALALSGCVVDTAEPGASGTGGSGALTVACGAMEEVCAAWTNAFTAETGIQTSFVRLSSGETVARLAATASAPEFDVWHGGPADGFGAATEQDLIEPYVSPNASVIPDRYKDADGNWTGVYVGTLGFCSNKTVLDELGLDLPGSWEDLLDPSLSRQVSTAHPSTSGTAFTTLWTQVTRLGGEDAALDYMKQLHNNVLQYTKSGTAPGQIAGRGEVAVGIVFSHDCVLYKERGMTDLEVSFPSEGTGYEVGGVAIIKGTDNLTAAQSYVDWALTKEAQELGPPVGSYQLPTNPDAAIDDRMVDLDSVTLVDYDFAAAAAAKRELTARFDAEVAAQPRE
ncbi:MAG: ABC transporter substrate-binding protein [Propionibacteriaceae bacterium]|nr:ABC transporter substrate-binding protein [Propionibacteriaceae bacterium]